MESTPKTTATPPATAAPPSPWVAVLPVTTEPLPGPQEVRLDAQQLADLLVDHAAALAPEKAHPYARVTFTPSESGEVEAVVTFLPPEDARAAADGGEDATGDAHALLEVFGGADARVPWPVDDLPPLADDAYDEEQTNAA